MNIKELGSRVNEAGFSKGDLALVGLLGTILSYQIWVYANYEPEREISDGVVIAKAYEEEKVFSRPKWIGPITRIYKYIDDADYILTVENCISGDSNEPNCVQEDLFVSEDYFEGASIGDEIKISGNPEVTIFDPDIRA